MPDIQLYAYDDGSVRECEGWQAPNQAKQKEILERAFSCNGIFRYDWINERDTLREALLYDSSENKKIIFALRAVSGGGRPQTRPHELRVQIQPETLNELAKCNMDGGIGLLLGVYVNDEAEAIAVWHPTQLSSGSKSASKQIDADVVARAMLTGYEMQVYPDGETAVWVGKPELFRAYLDYLELQPPLGTKETVVRNNDKTLPHNLIYFGAPGTGKSHTLNEEAKQFDEDKVERVTFHPDYTYAQFVGTLKPHSGVNEEGKHEIYYAFTPGPFIDTYVNALNDPEHKYLLIIEELNRANPAAVFGDIFQLLDRDAQGSSDYPVKTSEDLKQYLAKKLLPSKPAGEREEKASNMSLPSNMYIWATMNSADQGVFPMDTAFKRRWDFQYMDINGNEDAIKDMVLPLGKTQKSVKWNDMRRAINKVMQEARINEDKFLGPFFIDPDLVDDDNFVEMFKSKVLLYLVEDAAKTKKEKVFGNGSISYSVVAGDFDTKGEAIFPDLGDLTYIEDSQDDNETNAPDDGTDDNQDEE